ncbi:AV1 [Tomato leaf curl New Delhi virus 4]|uniref:Capsid protein n=1 Tax=Tomato leaf curl New Delhi virus 4 TaxID=2049944 RepID=V5N3B9_9GEMI|nr:AV1 [Tomato leaf curl New Delhi virus 4]AHA82273.1 AV1 [Tomato leaf curl New Delhi virus 4]
MKNRPADIIISKPPSKVYRYVKFDSPKGASAVVPIARVTEAKAWTNRPMNRKPRIYRTHRSPDVPRGREGQRKLHSIESRLDVYRTGKIKGVIHVTREIGLTHSVGKRFGVNSVYVLEKRGIDETIKPKSHTYRVMFFLVRDRRPTGTPQDFGDVFNMFDNEPSTATVKNMHRDRYQVLRKWHATVTGGTYASKEQALVSKFVRVNNYVVYNQQEAGKYENHTENALMLYMACTHASNPVYATLKIRIYFYDSVTN